MKNITQELAEFAGQIKWSDLPDTVVKETKMVLMEHIGCALGASTTDKGKMTTALARSYGGPPDSSVIGQGGKVSTFNAAQANGELFITLDYHDIIAGGHDGTYVIPAVLAIAEKVNASGQDLILALASGLEISARLARGVGRHNITTQDVARQKGSPRGITGNAYSNFGAAAGAGKLLGLNDSKILHAMGIAGHLCMVLSYARWGAGGHRYMAKYGVPGWQSTGAVNAVHLAEMGYTGDTTVLDDPERGFTYFVGYKNWYPDLVTENLGKQWIFPIRMHYKPYPCCGAFHGGLDCFFDIIEPNNLMPDDIEKVRIIAGAGSEFPELANKDIHGISGAQFNRHYNIAVAAHRVKKGVEWVDPDTRKDPSIFKFMDKISWQSHPDYMKELEKDPITNMAKAEVTARGKTYVVERKYRKGTVGTAAARTEAETIDKFKHNAERVLTQEKIERAVKALLAVDKLANIAELMREVTV